MAAALGGKGFLCIVETGGVDGDAVAHFSAEERADGQPALFAGDVPEGGVDCADGAAADAAGDVAIVENVEHLLPQPVALHRVCAQQQGCELLVDNLRGGAGQTLSPADNSIVGDKFDQAYLAFVGPALGPAKAGLDGGFKEKGLDRGDSHRWRSKFEVRAGAAGETAALAGRGWRTARVFDGWQPAKFIYRLSTGVPGFYSTMRGIRYAITTTASWAPVT